MDDFSWAANGWGKGKKTTFLKNMSHISHNHETWRSYALAKEDLKIL